MLPPLLLPTDRASGYAIGAKNPPIVADFARGLYLLNGRAKLFSELFTYSSASDRTYTNADGHFIKVPANTPRLDHHIWDGSRYVRDGLLLDAAGSENLLPWSAASATNWGAVSSIATDLSLNALGVFNGVQVASTGSGWNRLEEGVSGTATSGETLAITVWYRGGTSGNCRITLRNSTVAAESTLQGPVGALIVASANAGAVTILSQTSLPDGTHEVQLTITLTANFSFFSVGIGPNSTTAGEDIIALGAQVERSETPSQYIPTNGSPVNRAVDVLSIPSLVHNVNGFNPMPAGVSVHISGQMSYADINVSNTVVHYEWGNPSNRIGWRVDTNGVLTGRPRLFQQAGGGNLSVEGPDDHYTPGVRVPFSMATRSTATQANIAYEGTLSTQGTPAGLADTSAQSMRFGVVGPETTISLIRLWPEDIGNTGIQEASNV